MVLCEFMEFSDQVYLLLWLFVDLIRNKCKKLVTLLKKSEILLELLLLVRYVIKRVSSDSEKVMMHFPTKAYMSHTFHCESPRDVHPYVGHVVQVAWNRMILFFDANGCNLICWAKFRNFLTKFAYYCKYLLI
jgi:hypothetical protein